MKRGNYYAAIDISEINHERNPSLYKIKFGILSWWKIVSCTMGRFCCALYKSFVISKVKTVASSHGQLKLQQI